jgi:ABC-type uncharacterized transport system ATPase subunit
MRDGTVARQKQLVLVFSRVWAWVFLAGLIAFFATSVNIESRGYVNFLTIRNSQTLPDVFAVTNRIVVMHRGRRVAEKRTSETNSQEIVQYMVGALDDTCVS